ncbi:MAG: inosine/xanthosine triphosphatase [Candidatus Methanomethylophilaceae archaeon]|nr:inosine/xanthosine triphosphatase [Candidatus Methanomethylophilaceae archaeon]
MEMIAAVAGTFNILHDGHKALLDRAFEVGDRVMIGLTSDRMASQGRNASVSFDVRKKELEQYLSSRDNYTIFEIDDIYGPKEIMDNVDILVVSEETLSNGEKVNEERASRGIKPLQMSVVHLVISDDGKKISASSILEGRYSRSGKKDVIDIAVGSANPVKVAAVRSIMERIYGEVRITGIDVPSGVPPQPFGDQTHQGSVNRAKAALGDHNMAVGIEAGVFEMLDGLYDIQHCTVITRDGRMTFGQGSGFRYPDSIADLVRKGMTVGEAVKQVYGNTEIGKKQGAIGLLSNGLIDRKTLTEQSIIAAMIPRLRSD